MEFQARRYDTGQMIRLRISDDRIAQCEPVECEPVECEPVECEPVQGEPVECEYPWVAPGLVDLQVNGFGGQDFTDPRLTVEQVERISVALDSGGVTRYLPTITTHGHDVLLHALATIARASRESSEVARRAAGIHVEGPYISTEDGPRGAHPLAHCRPPDWDEFQRFQEAAEGRIRILTMSPEYEGSAPFIRRVADSGVIVAIGHTAASGEQVRAAVEAGARMSTHLGNGAHGQIRRHPNYIWDQLADDRLTASLIADGHHLPAAVLKTFVRAKTAERCVLVSDITGMAGMPPGSYEYPSLGAVEVLEDGRLVIPGQRQLLAGAALPLSVGIANVMRMAEVDLKTAIEMAAVRPAEMIGLTPSNLESGNRADLVVFDLPVDEPMRVRATILAGRLVHGSVEFPLSA